MSRLDEFFGYRAEEVPSPDPSIDSFMICPLAVADKLTPQQAAEAQRLYRAAYEKSRNAIRHKRGNDEFVSGEGI
jgi:hypothetical protein